MPRRGSANRLSDDELAAWQGLLRAGVRFQRELDAELRSSHGLSGSDYDVLIQLGLSPTKTLRMSDLAQEVLMSHNGVSRVVAQLEADGLVTRERDAQDGRAVHVTLTPHGREVLQSANRAHLTQVRARFLDRLSDEQLSQLRTIWDAVDPTLVAGRPRAPR
ncbi:MarR family transcriptional regulator [Solirubrobacter phytolaccae]|uniref:MarR family transcriptional regulator n=1 Tax=Solirubrobacter phytolaccae TaxID=1404360 RepID=A0A9X3N6H9_9ACTN|nr:MarR family transcriptional regulator [Solirubrobacter phytolaccae]MDA0180376.1 MarR family transcriptional regulator [Solirubrobacter phytolaccae]